MKNWYKIAQYDNIIEQFLSLFRPQSLKGLAAEALKVDSFEEFEKDYTIEIKHGTYWHLTKDPNFQIDPKKGPSDASSLATGQMTAGKLMVSTHLENWIAYMEDRKFVAEIDMSMVPRNSFHQVKRGFGNEFWVDDPSKAKVIQVLPLKKALKINAYRRSKIPQSKESLQEFYNKVKIEFGNFINTKKENENVNNKHI